MKHTFAHACVHVRVASYTVPSVKSGTARCKLRVGKGENGEPLTVIRQRDYSSLKSHPSFYRFASTVCTRLQIYSLEKPDVTDLRLSCPKSAAL